MIVVVSLFDYESSNRGFALGPFVMKGQLPSIQAHCRFDSSGGCHGGLVENEVVVFVLVPKGKGCEGMRLSCSSFVNSSVPSFL